MDFCIFQDDSENLNKYYFNGCSLYNNWNVVYEFTSNIYNLDFVFQNVRFAEKDFPIKVEKQELLILKRKITILKK